MILVVPLALLVTVALHAAEPRWGIIELDDLREGQLEAAGAVVLMLLGGVLLGRARRDGSRRSLLLGTAFLILAATSLFAAIATPVVDSLARSPFATWTAAGGGALGALLLAAGALAAERTARHGRTVAAGGLALATIALASALLEGLLPAAFERAPATAEEIAPGTQHPALLVVQLVTAAACWVAAWRLAVLADAEGDALWRRLALGLGIAAVAFVNYAVFPSQLTELLYVGDAFFLLAIAVLLWSAIMEITSTEGTLVRRAVSSERTRVADELRAGIAQELAFMASQTELFARGRRHSLDELAASVERALDSSRGAIAALARPVDEPLSVAIAEAARDAAANHGARVELALATDVDVERGTRDALARLVHECVTEATRQRGARSLTVELHGGRSVVLRILDDGRPATPTLSQDALRERAEALGATYTRPAGGTAVEVIFPRR